MTATGDRLRPVTAPSSASGAASASIRVLVWNLEWRRARERLRLVLDDIDPDVAILTETSDTDAFSGGWWAASDADYGYRAATGRRKVRIWSRYPHRSVDSTGSPDLPTGRYVSAQVAHPNGLIRVIGVCIPWRDAHVRTGRSDRRRWEDHLRFLEGLGPILDEARGPCVLGGDWNQRIPRERQPMQVAEALTRALPKAFEVLSAGKIPGLERRVIDHLAVSGGPRLSGIRGVPRHAGGDRPLTDHDGVVVDLCLG